MKEIAVGQRPGVTLPRHGAELVGHRQALFVRGHDGGKKFAGEFVPEMVEEIFHRAADAAVVIGGAEDQDVRPLHAALQRGKSGDSCAVSGL